MTYTYNVLLPQNFMSGLNFAIVKKQEDKQTLILLYQNKMTPNINISLEINIFLTIIENYKHMIIADLFY